MDDDIPGIGEPGLDLASTPTRMVTDDFFVFTEWAKTTATRTHKSGSTHRSWDAQMVYHHHEVHDMGGRSCSGGRWVALGRMGGTWQSSRLLSSPKEPLHPNNEATVFPWRFVAFTE